MVGAKGCFADLRASLAYCWPLYPTTRASNPPRPLGSWVNKGKQKAEAATASLSTSGIRVRVANLSLRYTPRQQ
jgi:hypothetical protein